MMSTELKHQITSFIELISSEKGYATNTCRAYLHDLTELAAFIRENFLSEKESQKAWDHFGADQIDSLMIRSYLGFLSKKNKKVTITKADQILSLMLHLLNEL